MQTFINMQQYQLLIVIDTMIHYFVRLQMLEDDKIRREHEFHLRQTVLENHRRREEREHEMRMLRMMIDYPPEDCTPEYTLTKEKLWESYGKPWAIYGNEWYGMVEWWYGVDMGPYFGKI